MFNIFFELCDSYIEEKFKCCNGVILIIFLTLMCCENFKQISNLSVFKFKNDELPLKIEEDEVQHYI